MRAASDNRSANRRSMHSMYFSATRYQFWFDARNQYKIGIAIGVNIDQFG
jgi:hypothetical protein